MTDTVKTKRYRVTMMMEPHEVELIENAMAAQTVRSSYASFFKRLTLQSLQSGHGLGERIYPETMVRDHNAVVTFLAECAFDRDDCVSTDMKNKAQALLNIMRGGK